MPSVVGRQLKVGHNFREVFRQSSLSRSDVAELFGVDNSTITYWFRRGVSEKYATEVARLFNVKVEHIHKPRAGRTYKSAKTQTAKKHINASNQHASLRPDLIILLANTELTDDQADMILALIKVYKGEGINHDLETPVAES